VSTDEPREYLVRLLKHAWLRLAELTNTALEPYGIDGRELAVLNALTGHDPLSQQQLARRLEVDRTTMVTLIDGLQRKALLERRPDPADRRKNLVALTDAGRDVRGRAARAAVGAEHRFLAPLPDRQTAQLTDALRALLAQK
jgi:DNA-binding MarR family transcriptional regulator